MPLATMIGRSAGALVGVVGTATSAGATGVATVGGAVMGAAAGAARGAARGMGAGKPGPVRVTPAVVLGAAALAVAGVLDWPIAVAGAAGAVMLDRLAGQGRTRSRTAADSNTAFDRDARTARTAAARVAAKRSTPRATSAAATPTKATAAKSTRARATSSSGRATAGPPRTRAAAKRAPRKAAGS